MWVNYSHLPQSNIRRTAAEPTEEGRWLVSVWHRGSAVPMGEECDASPHCGRLLSGLDRCLLRLGSKKLDSDILVSNVRVVMEASGQEVYVSWGKTWTTAPRPPNGRENQPGPLKILEMISLDLTSMWGLNSR